MRFAEEQRKLVCRDRLLGRRAVVVRTLGYLDAELDKSNAIRQEGAAEVAPSRKRFLNEIHEWYAEEAKRIEVALEQLDRASEVTAH